jgi:hypothetical protein
LALRASRPAAITLRGLEVLVQLVIAAMIDRAIGHLAGRFVPSAWQCRVPARSAVGRRADADSTGPAMLRTTVRQVERRARARTRDLGEASDHRPATFA